MTVAVEDHIVMEKEEREQIRNLIRKAFVERTLASVETAFAHMEAWLCKHPDDNAIYEVGGSLSMLEDALRIVEAEKATDKAT